MNYIPQGAMHRMRAGYADGAPVRNRSFEQQRTRSGNPNMPIFNSSSRQLLGAAGHMQPRGGMGYLGSNIVDQNAVNADPQAYQEYLRQAALQQPNSAFGQIGMAQGYGRPQAPQSPFGSPFSGSLPQLMGGMAPTKPAQSFHRPPVNAPVGGALPGRGVMPQMAAPEEQGSRYVSYFGRNLPIRMRG